MSKLMSLLIRALGFKIDLPTFGKKTDKEVSQVLTQGFKAKEPETVTGMAKSASISTVNAPNLHELKVDILLKESVRIGVLKPVIWAALPLIAEVFSNHKKTAVITSWNDSIHKEGSWHYKDLALDLRSKMLRNLEEKQEVLEELQRALPNWVWLFENNGELSEHFHGHRAVDG